MIMMALMVFVLAVFVPAGASAAEKKLSPEQKTISNAAFYSDAPDLSLAPEPLPKLNVLFFALPRLWALMLAFLTPDVQTYKAVSQQFFIQKINFVFVSSLAP